MKTPVTIFVLALLVSCALPTLAPADQHRPGPNHPENRKPAPRPTPPPRSGVVYIDGPSFEIRSLYNDPTPLDMNNDGTPDFTFFSGGPVCTASIPPHCWESFLVGGSETNQLLVDVEALVQSRGALIGDDAPRGASWATPGSLGVTLTGNNLSPVSTWTGSLGELGAGYLGVRFSASDGLHYGWFRVRLPHLQPVNGLIIGSGPVVVDWGYERRPNTPIRAGEGAREIECEDLRGRHHEHSGQSGIVGRLMLEQMGVRFDWRVRVSTEQFELVKDLDTNDQGYFRVNLKPGKYYVTPFLGGDGGATLIVSPSVRVVVQKKRFTTVQLPLVFGPIFPSPGYPYPLPGFPYPGYPYPLPGIPYPGDGWAVPF